MQALVSGRTWFKSALRLFLTTWPGAPAGHCASEFLLGNDNADPPEQRGGLRVCCLGGQRCEHRLAEASEAPSGQPLGCAPASFTLCCPRAK